MIQQRFHARHKVGVRGFEVPDVDMMKEWVFVMNNNEPCPGFALYCDRNGFARDGQAMFLRRNLVDVLDVDVDVPSAQTVRTCVSR